MVNSLNYTQDLQEHTAQNHLKGDWWASGGWSGDGDRRLHAAALLTPFLVLSVLILSVFLKLTLNLLSLDFFVFRIVMQSFSNSHHFCGIP